MTVIYLVRHGHVHNPDAVFYGRLPNFRLSEQGQKEAKRLGKYLSKKNLGAIYASPLQRAQETAGFIAVHHPHLAVTTEERVIEVYSPLQGQRYEMLEEIDWNWFLPEYIAQGGETMEAIWERMRSALQDLEKRHEGQEIVIVSHGDPIMIAQIMFAGNPLTFENVRGRDYVDTARGFELCLVSGACISLKMITP